MLLHTILLIAGMALLYFGAEDLVRGNSSLAFRLKLTPVVDPLENLGLSLIDVLLMIGLAVVLLPLGRSGWQLSLWHGGLLMTIYAAYLVNLTNNPCPNT